MNYEMIDAKKVMGEAVYEMARDHENIVMISTDSASRSGFSAFIKDFPDRYFELGIMEQSALSVASGFATTGKIPIFCAPAPFVTGRPFEMFKVDLGYMRQNVKIIGRNCGFNYSDLGPTHYGLEDYGLIRMIPKVVILAPQDASELKAAIKAMLEYAGPVYLRLSAGSIPKIFDEKPFQIGKGNVIRDGKDIAIVTTGEITLNVLAATEALVSYGIDPMVIGMPTIRPIDEALVIEAAKKTGKVVTVEEHFDIGGLGTIVCELCSASCPVPVLRLGVPSDYINSGPYKDLMAEVGLDTDHLVAKIAEFANVDGQRQT